MPAPHHIIVCLVLLVAACGDDAGQRGGEAGQRQNGADPEGTAGMVDSADAEATRCHEAGQFVDDGSIPLETSAGTGNLRLSEIRWISLEDCERIVLQLTRSTGAPAQTTGDVHAEILRSHGIVRIEMPDVETVDTAATDADLEGPLADKAYAVFSPEGRWIFVDLHLGSEAEVFATTIDDSARIVVELRPGGDPLPPPAATSDRVVVIRPKTGLVSYPLDVAGYARTFEANVVARLEHDGEEVADTFTTATGWAEAWGYYSMSFEDGPTGDVDLHVGEHSARDGTWQGVAVELEVR